MRILDTRVAPEWVDYNGHMNDAEYARVFSLAVDALMERIGLDEAGRERESYTLFTLETHLCFRHEAHEGESLTVAVVLLDRDAKRLHAFFTLYNADDEAIATSEQMLMGMGRASARPEPFPAPVAKAIESLPHASAEQWPSAAGRRIGIRR